MLINRRHKAYFAAINNSWRSIFVIAVPMVLALITYNLFFVIDRFMMLNYSVDAMNAVVASSNFCSVISCFFSGLAGMSEIYVGRYNGAKQFRLAAQPTWQMIYLALASCVIFFPLGYFSNWLNLLPEYYEAVGVNYQRIIMYGGPLTVLYVTLVAFFAGHGRSNLVTLCSLVGIVSNIVFDYLLIYGVKGWWPAYGESGAAYSTLITQAIQLVILAAIFFSRRYREHFRTGRPKVIPALANEIAVKGFPIACNEAMTMLAWYVIVTLVDFISKDVATIYALGSSIFSLQVFLGDGLCKSSAALAANFIGRGDLKGIHTVVWRLIVIAQLLIGGLIGLGWLVAQNNWMFSAGGNFMHIMHQHHDHVVNMLIILFAYVEVDSVMSILWGVLIAGGDTAFSSFMYQLMLWVCVVVPVGVLFMMHRLTGVEQPFGLSLWWAIVTTGIFLWRYFGKKWNQPILTLDVPLTGDSEPQPTVSECAPPKL